MKKLCLILMAALLCFGMVACGGTSTDTPAGGDTPTTKTLNFNVGFEPDNFDPQASNVLETSIHVAQIYDFLYREDVDGNFVPSLASGYTVSDDNLTYTFTLRDGITFADGTYEYGSKDASGHEYKDGVTETAGVKFNGANFYLTYDNGTTKNETLSTKSDSSNTKFSYTYNISDNNVAEGTKTWKFKADASCPASDRYPVTNLGNFVKADGTTTTNIAEASGNTAAQTKTGLGEKTFTVTGWRGCFWGYKTSKALDPDNLTSAQIRALSTASNGLSATITQSLNKMQQIFIAAPKGKYTTVTVTNTDLGAPQTVKKVTDVSVYDATGNSNAAAYDVFYVSNDNADSKAYNYKITIA